LNIYAEKNFKCLARIFYLQETKIALARQIKFSQLEDGKYFVFRKDTLLLPNVSRVRKFEKHLRKQLYFTKNVAQLLLNTDVKFLKKHQPKLTFFLFNSHHTATTTARMTFMGTLGVVRHHSSIYLQLQNVQMTTLIIRMARNHLHTEIILVTSIIILLSNKKLEPLWFVSELPEKS
jgi:hypothetical protein